MVSAILQPNIEEEPVFNYIWQLGMGQNGFSEIYLLVEQNAQHGMRLRLLTASPRIVGVRFLFVLLRMLLVLVPTVGRHVFLSDGRM
jgi:hypothetical protein